METRGDQAARDKVVDLLKGVRVAMMATTGEDGRKHARPMATNTSDIVPGTLISSPRPIDRLMSRLGAMVSWAFAGRAGSPASGAAANPASSSVAVKRRFIFWPLEWIRRLLNVRCAVIRTPFTASCRVCRRRPGRHSASRWPGFVKPGRRAKSRRSWWIARG